jgi:hypothetical protein
VDFSIAEMIITRANKWVVMWCMNEWQYNHNVLNCLTNLWPFFGWHIEYMLFVVETEVSDGHKQQP